MPQQPPSEFSAPADLFAKPEIQAHWRPDGSLVLRSKREPGAGPPAIGHWLEHWGLCDPTRPFLAERDALCGWWRLSYGEVLGQARAVGQALLDRRLDAARPILILADNSIDHALMMLGALHVGQAVAPVSTAYARLSQDFGKLRYIAGLLQPPLVFVDDAERYRKALGAIGLERAEIVASRGTCDGRLVTPFASLAATMAGPDVDRALARIGPATLAKVLFTSGSTGNPKGVINAHGMLVANQESLAAIWPFLQHTPPQLVDWLPWNHTFGGNHNFNLVLRNGGTLSIDGGRPLPGLIERTVANLVEVSPTIYFNVPRGYGVLLDHLERDSALRAGLFARLQLLFYSGAALPQTLWQRLAQISELVVGRRVPMVSGWGATETAPVVTSVHFDIEAPGNIGVPLPGTAVKLVPAAGKLAILAKGANVTPGYFREPALSARAFDAEGWLVTGDAVRFADAADVAKGLIFDGRIAESFKLSTGTWVNVGVLRTAAISALAPLVDDCVVTGHDGDEIGLLVFPSLTALRQVAGLAADADIVRLVGHPAVLARLSEGLARHNAMAGGSSERIARVMVLAEPPSPDAGEITDKGYLNQRAVLERRQALVAELHRDPAGPGIVRPA